LKAEADLLRQCGLMKSSVFKMINSSIQDAPGESSQPVIIIHPNLEAFLMREGIFLTSKLHKFQASRTKSVSTFQILQFTTT
jgi:hypothetical protein